jgi:SOS response associated peptidase (SRAP)
MCGRFTVEATWAELVALYRLTMDAPPHNLRPRYNVCPTDPVDVVTVEEGQRELVTMRWGLVPWWWSKPLRELRMATFNARAETVETMRSSARAASFRSRGTTNGRTLPAESSPGTSPPLTAHRFSRLLAFGTSGGTARPASG